MEHASNTSLPVPCLSWCAKHEWLAHCQLSRAHKFVRKKCLKSYVHSRPRSQAQETTRQIQQCSVYTKTTPDNDCKQTTSSSLERSQLSHLKLNQYWSCEQLCNLRTVSTDSVTHSHFSKSTMVPQFNCMFGYMVQTADMADKKAWSLTGTRRDELSPTLFESCESTTLETSSWDKKNEQQGSSLLHLQRVATWAQSASNPGTTGT